MRTHDDHMISRQLMDVPTDARYLMADRRDAITMRILALGESIRSTHDRQQLLANPHPADADAIDFASLSL